MTAVLDSLRDVAGRYDALVFDQFGVLHDGHAPAPGVVDLLRDLCQGGHRLALLTNSGKRAATNAARLAKLGISPDLFELILSSGEALWRDLARGHVAARRFFPMTADPRDAETWAEGLDIGLCPPDQADAVLLMGLPEGSDGRAQAERLATLRHLPIYCTNPDLASPRPDGKHQVSPGRLARDVEAAGGQVTYYGKPHRPIYDTLSAMLDVRPDRLLMIGDSLAHDIVGAAAAGWDSAFVCSGLHADQFTPKTDIVAATRALAREASVPEPTFVLQTPR